MPITTTTENNVGTPGHDPFPIKDASTLQVDKWWHSLQAGVIGAVDFKERARELEIALAAEKADHTDTQQKWNETMDVGLCVVKERDQLLAALRQCQQELANLTPHSTGEEMAREAIAEVTGEVPPWRKGI